MKPSTAREDRVIWSYHSFSPRLFWTVCLAPVTVNRLVRVSYGDYHLPSLPAGGAMEVKAIAIREQKSRGLLFQRQKRPTKTDVEAEPPAIQWVKYH